MFILMPCIKEHISNTLMGWQSDIAESLFSDWTKLVEVYDSVLAQEKVEDWGNIDESLHILNILSTTERSEASLKGWNILTFCSETSWVKHWVETFFRMIHKLFKKILIIYCDE